MLSVQGMYCYIYQVQSRNMKICVDLNGHVDKPDCFYPECWDNIVPKLVNTDLICYF